MAASTSGTSAAPSAAAPSPGSESGSRSAPRLERLRDRSGSRSRSGCGCSPSRASASEAWSGACARRRRRSDRRGSSRSPTPAGRSRRAPAPCRRGRRAPGGARTRGGSTRGSRRPRRPGTGRAGSPARRRPEGPMSSRVRPRRWRRTTASIRAITSSGWQGFAIQSSAPRRSPRTRWATVAPWVQTITPEVGEHPADPLEEVPRQRAEQRRDRRRARSASSPPAPRPAPARRASGTGSRPASRRLARTCTKPESSSMTATRSVARLGRSLDWPRGRDRSRRPRLARPSRHHGSRRRGRQSSRRSQNFHRPLLGMFTSGRGGRNETAGPARSPLSCGARPHSLPRVARLLFAPSERRIRRTPVAISSSTVIPTSTR